MKKHKTIVLTGGGTGGHIYPAVAVAQALSSKDQNLKIHFVGADRPLDRAILENVSYPFHLLGMGPLNTSNSLQKIISLLRIPLAIFRALGLLVRLRPALVMGFGGYASFPALAAAKILRIPIAVWEANAVPGMVTRTFGKNANLIFLAFADSSNLFPIKRTYLFGIPTRFQALQKDRVESGARFRLLIFGGSSGARAINEIVHEFLKKVNAGKSGFEKFKNFEFVHQIGKTDHSRFQNLYKDFRIHLDVREFIHNMPEELAKADFVICRAGASTIAELALSKKAALFVPLPWAADNHQVLNAKRLADVGAALMIEQKDFTVDTLRDCLEDISEKPEVLRQMETKVEAFANAASAQKIAQKILDYISYQSLL